MNSTDQKSILWNLKNGGLITIEQIDDEDFEVAGIPVETLSDGELWKVITLLKKELMESLSSRINAAFLEASEQGAASKK